MKFYRTYHPKSWSEEAREFADRMYKQYIEALNEPEELYPIYFHPAIGTYELVSSHDRQLYFGVIQYSYRHPKIVQRAAKRFGRLYRGESKINE